MIDGQDITKLDEDELALLRGKRFGFIFQNFHLIPTLTALENVVLAAELNNSPGATKKANDLLGTVGLSDRLHHYPVQLSGGEQQRLSLARAFVNEPDIILADEPTGNLDSKNSDRIIELMLELHRVKTGNHHPGDARTACRRRLTTHPDPYRMGKSSRTN